MGVTRKQSIPNLLKNEMNIYPVIRTPVCVSGGKKCSFFGKFGMLCFLVTPILRFALLSHYWQFVLVNFDFILKIIIFLQVCHK